ncbi:NADH dehydrogenase [ubiquinone] 1 beta subcomplex subunit 2, mitochondrial-like [Liolophura sinensis]|uniref:NADH dehydrogenase [ubiquinone] 1 beta subcomplex subunit 2, mitochondrial-like n=1 Tax=Liolophura sinensis TaxID=3198878 RepID=UPI0031583BBB
MFAVSNLRAVSTVLKRNIGSVRNAGAWTYREPPAPPPRYITTTAEVVGAIAWYWFLWHLWYQPEHVFGHFPYPDPSKWTDEELGIPPDDAD